MSYISRVGGLNREPEASALLTFKALETYQPETSDVVGAYAGEVLDMPGGFRASAEDAELRQIERSQEGPRIDTLGLKYGYVTKVDGGTADEKMTEEAWKESEHFREGLEWNPNFTENYAKILADRRDRQQYRDFIISRASGGQKAVGIGAGFAAGLLDPVNVATAFIPIPGIGAAKWGALAERIGTTGMRLTKGAAEGAFGGLITEPLALSSAERLQEDYQVQDSLLNIAMSSLFGSVLHFGAGVVGDKFKGVTPRQHTEALGTAISQHIDGRPVNVKPVMMDNGVMPHSRNMDIFDPNYFMDESLPLSRVPEARPFELGELSGKGTGARYKAYTPVRPGETKWVEGVNAEVQQAERGGLTFLEQEGTGSTPQVMGQKSTAPEWFRQYNKNVKDMQSEAKAIKRRNEKLPPSQRVEVPKVPEILTKKKIASVTNKLLKGEPLGVSEGEIADTIMSVARENRLTNAQQMVEARYGRSALRREEIDAVAEREAEYWGDIEANFAPENRAYTDVNASRSADEVLSTGRETLEIKEYQAAIEELDTGIAEYERLGFLNESEKLELSDLDTGIARAADVTEGAQTLGFCMGTHV